MNQNTQNNNTNTPVEVEDSDVLVLQTIEAGAGNTHAQERFTYVSSYAETIKQYQTIMNNQNKILGIVERWWNSNEGGEYVNKFSSENQDAFASSRNYIKLYQEHAYDLAEKILWSANYLSEEEKTALMFDSTLQIFAAFTYVAVGHQWTQNLGKAIAQHFARGAVILLRNKKRQAAMPLPVINVKSNIKNNYKHTFNQNTMKALCAANEKTHITNDTLFYRIDRSIISQDLSTLIEECRKTGSFIAVSLERRHTDATCVHTELGPLNASLQSSALRTLVVPSSSTVNSVAILGGFSPATSNAQEQPKPLKNDQSWHVVNVGAPATPSFTTNFEIPLPLSAPTTTMYEISYFRPNDKNENENMKRKIIGMSASSNMEFTFRNSKQITSIALAMDNEKAAQMRDSGQVAIMPLKAMTSKYARSAKAVVRVHRKVNTEKGLKNINEATQFGVAQRLCEMGFWSSILPDGNIFICKKGDPEKTKLQMSDQSEILNGIAVKVEGQDVNLIKSFYAEQRIYDPKQQQVNKSGSASTQEEEGQVDLFCTVHDSEGAPLVQSGLDSLVIGVLSKECLSVLPTSCVSVPVSVTDDSADAVAVNVVNQHPSLSLHKNTSAVIQLKRWKYNEIVISVPKTISDKIISGRRCGANLSFDVARSSERVASL